jgi:hypothetical protein
VGFSVGEKRRKMEEEKGIIIRFIIGHRLVHKSVYSVIYVQDNPVTILWPRNIIF